MSTCKISLKSRGTSSEMEGSCEFPIGWAVSTPPPLGALPISNAIVRARCTAASTPLPLGTRPAAGFPKRPARRLAGAPARAFAPPSAASSALGGAAAPGAPPSSPPTTPPSSPRRCTRLSFLLPAAAETRLRARLSRQTRQRLPMPRSAVRWRACFRPSQVPKTAMAQSTTPWLPRRRSSTCRNAWVCRATCRLMQHVGCELHWARSTERCNYRRSITEKGRAGSARARLSPSPPAPKSA